jgi:hypothetical protein
MIGGIKISDGRRPQIVYGLADALLPEAVAHRLAQVFGPGHVSIALTPLHRRDNAWTPYPVWVKANAN